MGRAYLRLDPGFYDRKVIDQGYPAGAALALIGALCHAEFQPTRGRFRSPAVLKTLLGPHAKWVGYLIEHKDLVAKKGQLYIEGWDEWQEGDWKVRERVQRIRGRRSVTPDVTVGVTPDVTVGVTVNPDPDVTVATVYNLSDGGRQSVIDSVSGKHPPLPPTSGGLAGGRRANGTSSRQVATAAQTRYDDAIKARRGRSQQRQLAVYRGVINDEQRIEMNERDAPLDEIPDWRTHLAETAPQ